MSTRLDIKKMRSKVGMSQKDLAERLGISRPTLVKIEKGDRPLTLVEQTKVRQIFDLASNLLIDHQDDIRINIPQKRLDKFQQVFLYLLNKTSGKPNVGQTVLYKLLYFVDFDYYEKYEEQFMGLTYMRNHFGPTPREFASVVGNMKKEGLLEEVQSSYFTYEQKKFLPRVEPDLSLLNARELEMIESVIDRYADKSASELSDLTHEDTPWIAAEDGKNIEYDHVFYRPQLLSVREYSEL